MTDDKKEPGTVSEFAPRRQKKFTSTPPAAIKSTQDPGGAQGTFDRPLCGDCIHWKQQPAQGLGFGTCMMMPPTAIPVPGPDGSVRGIMNIRPGMKAGDEGCDQFEDEAGNGVFDDDEDDPDGGIPAAATG